MLEKFLTYYEAFEQTYIDDDWSRLEPLFAEDAVYRVRGGTSFDCDLQGRSQVFRGIRIFLDGFDRRCERRIENISDPMVGEDWVKIHGAAFYKRGDSTELALELHETITFREGLIVSIEDLYPPDLEANNADWLERWGADLVLSYV